MRISLSSAAKRARRLSDKSRRSAQEIRSELLMLNEGEFQRRWLALLERAAGPASDFPTADHFVKRLEERLGTLHPEKAAMCRSHWARVSWLRRHPPHGGLHVVVTELCVQPDYGPWGPGVVVACPCGETLAILRELMPKDLAALPHHHVERQADFIPPWSKAGVGTVGSS